MGTVVKLAKNEEYVNLKPCFLEPTPFCQCIRQPEKFSLNLALVCLTKIIVYIKNFPVDASCASPLCNS